MSSVISDIRMSAESEQTATLPLLPPPPPETESVPLTHFFPRPQIVHELMTKEIREILLVSSPYNIVSLVESGELEAKFLYEYKGLHLGPPPRITGVSTSAEAIWLMRNKRFDLVLIAPNGMDPNIHALGLELKKVDNSIPVFLLLSRIEKHARIEEESLPGIDRAFIWSGGTDLLLAIIKTAEDGLNADMDTQKANVRVLLLVEDSPEYYSFFLPAIYKEISEQTQALIDSGLNEKKKLLALRARPKILLAVNHEEAESLYRKYGAYLLCVISDTRLPISGKPEPLAGVSFLSKVRKDMPELPLLLMSSEPENRDRADAIPAVFMDKNTPNLAREIHNFFLPHLGFGDFIFRMPDGRIVGRASSLPMLHTQLSQVPDESIAYHAERNHFSNWLMARSEFELALQYRDIKSSDFGSVAELRAFLISSIHELRKDGQRGIVATFNPKHFDPKIDTFVKIGWGSVGGKARGLAFMSALLRRHSELHRKFPEFEIKAPGTLVLCTDVFETFIQENHLQRYAGSGFTDEEISAAFENAVFPESAGRQLEAFLAGVRSPLFIRSSRLQEDTCFQQYQQLYRNAVLLNTMDSLGDRLERLIHEIKRVYASIFFAEPKSARKNSGYEPAHESMAVIVQQLVGNRHGDYFYPAVSGVTASYNCYPFAHMKPEEGIVRMTLGLGMNIPDNDRIMRFSPKHPAIIPQFSSVEDTLRNSQREFFALRMDESGVTDVLSCNTFGLPGIVKRDLAAAENEFPVKALASTYCREEHRIRDCASVPGTRVLTFASLLKYDNPPLPRLLSELLAIGRKGLGCPVEIDFAVNLYPDSERKNEFYVLQIRPMHTEAYECTMEIAAARADDTLCFSNHALGIGGSHPLTDIVYVKPETFGTEWTVEIAEEIRNTNQRMLESKRPYLLVGPGRWGSSDRWLGIPVAYPDISGACAIIELRNEKITAEPSRGSHFFNHITSKGIPYITINEMPNTQPLEGQDFFKWEQLNSQPAMFESTFVRHVQMKQPLMLKIDGRRSKCAIVRG